MTLYLPASEDLPIFNTSVFTSTTGTLTTTIVDRLYVKYPQSQGSEMFNTDITVNGKIYNTLLDASLNKIRNFYLGTYSDTHCLNSFWADKDFGCKGSIYDVSGNKCPISYLTGFNSDPQTALDQVSKLVLIDGTTHSTTSFIFTR